MDQPRLHGCGAAWRRGAKWICGLASPDRRMRSVFTANQGADGLRADHFYLTRSSTDWLARVQRCRNALVVVGSAATQPLPTRYDLWGHRDRRSHVRQRIRGILRLKRANGVKRSQEVYVEARTSRFSTEIRTLRVERIVDELGFLYTAYTKCDTTPLISTSQVSLNIHRLDSNSVSWKKGKLSSRLEPERDRFKPFMNTLGNKKDTRKKNYRIDSNFSSTLPERFFVRLKSFFPFIIFK